MNASVFVSTDGKHWKEYQNPGEECLVQDWFCVSGMHDESAEYITGQYWTYCDGDEVTTAVQVYSTTDFVNFVTYTLSPNNSYPSMLET